MRERILGFVQALREEGLAVSVAEALDAVSAVAAAGVERPVLREALAATLVKDQAHRALFDAAFAAAFPALATGASAAPSGRASSDAAGRAGASPPHGGGGRPGRDAPPRAPRAPDDPPRPRERLARWAERFHEDIAGSQLVILDGVGHVPHEEDPGRSVEPVEKFLG